MPELNDFLDGAPMASSIAANIVCTDTEGKGFFQEPQLSLDAALRHCLKDATVGLDLALMAEPFLDGAVSKQAKPFVDHFTSTWKDLAHSLLFRLASLVGFQRSIYKRKLCDASQQGVKFLLLNAPIIAKNLIPQATLTEAQTLMHNDVLRFNQPRGRGKFRGRFRGSRAFRGRRPFRRGQFFRGGFSAQAGQSQGPFGHGLDRGFPFRGRSGGRRPRRRQAFGQKPAGGS
jgi:hypothetical protein